ncbi:MAG: hypothetical protein COA57_00810 [Flavobacteriales bacterium]|nr:MAG: hypothetical protein COA57_00810 [Flavobacteriales bacterium]
MKFNRIIALLALGFVMHLPFTSFSQCKFFGQKMCSRYLDTYKSNGQDNTASMGPGETATIQMIFYKGHDYRLVFCSEEHLGELGIKIKSSRGDVLFDNADHDMSFHWDFTMKRTQRFIIEVIAAGMSEEEAMEGCVAIAVGVTPSIHKGFN